MHTFIDVFAYINMQCDMYSYPGFMLIALIKIFYFDIIRKVLSRSKNNTAHFEN